jgi:hypothetical protein
MTSAERAYQPLEVPVAPELTEAAATPTTSETPASPHNSRQLSCSSGSRRKREFAARFSALGLLAVGLAAVVGAALAAHSLGPRRGADGVAKEGDEGSTATIFLEAEHAEDAQASQQNSNKAEGEHGSMISTSSAEGTWEVVYDSDVHVRSEKDMDSKVIGRKRHGDIVIGQRDGDWLSLACEVGFLKIEIDSVPVVKERAQSYTMLSKGSCAQAGKRPVSGIFECEVAAASIGLSDIVATVSVDESRPQGCFVDWDTEKLWLDTNPRNAGNGAMDQYQPLCLDEVASRCGDGKPVTTPLVAPSQKGQPEESTQSASLFCFEVLNSANEVEVGLVREQYKFHGSIFDCDEWGVFGDSSVTRLSPEEQTPAVYTTRVPGPGMRGNAANWTMWQNTSAMLRVWSHIQAMGRYQRHDYVVKVDPDTVFVAERLRINLQWYQQHQHLSKSEGVYFRNCLGVNKELKSMESSIEVYSRPAIDQFFDQQQHCLAEIPSGGLAEEKFMADCMDLLKIKPMYDWNLLSDYKCGDNPSKCDDTFKVAFHPFKDVGYYAFCLRQTNKR